MCARRYAPLATHNDPTLEEAIAGWAPLVANLSAFSAAQGGKPFVFPEIGYASYAGAATDAPDCCKGPPDPGTQATLYQAFFSAVWGQPWMAGAFWWAWMDDTPGGTPCSTSFDVFRKPAAGVVASYYGSGGGAAARPPPLGVYTNGATSFADWSWGGVFDLGARGDPYPGHAMCATAAVGAGGGALALASPRALDLTGYTALEFDVRANASEGYTLEAFLCACADCGDCPVLLPRVSVDDYCAACDVPSAWDAAPAAAHVVVPLAALLPDARVGVLRVQLGAPAALDFAVDNIVFT